MKRYPPEDFFHGTQLMLAQAIYEGDLNAVSALAKQTDLNRPGEEQMTLLFFALQNAFGKQKNQLGIVTELVKQGADPLQRVPDFGCAAGVMARSPHPEFMQALLDGGLSPNATIEDTPLIFDASHNSTLATLALLVERGAEVNKRDSLQRTALAKALASFQLDAVDWLLDHGADPRVKWRNGGSFSRMLSFVKSRQGRPPEDEEKLDNIISKAVALGMTWPAL